MSDYKNQSLNSSLQNSPADEEPLNEASLALKALIQQWIHLTLQPHTRSSNYTCWSLKNEFERCTGIYITNAQFGAAMLNLGYLPKDPAEADWHFKIQPRYTPKGPSYEIHIHCINNAPDQQIQLFNGYLARFKATYSYSMGGAAHQNG